MRLERPTPILIRNCGEERRAQMWKVVQERGQFRCAHDIGVEFGRVSAADALNLDFSNERGASGLRI